MIDFIFAIVAMAAAANPPSTMIAADTSRAQESAGVFAAPAGLVAEAQTASGKFLTATEVKPILSMTKANWIGVREYGGNDLLYLTHLWSWRCGLAAMGVSINEGPIEDLPLPDCHTEYATPNAILEQDGLPYLTYPARSISTVTVHIVYDDLTRDSATYMRADVLIP